MANMTTTERKPRPWQCKRCSNVVGVIRRNTQHITVLDVFRYPVTLTYFEQAVEGLVQKDYCALSAKEAEFPCVQCGHINAWYANEEAMKEMLRRREKRRSENNAIIKA